MSTEKNTHADDQAETQRIDPMDETRPMDQTQSIKPVDERQPIDPIDETQRIDPMDETQPIDPVDETQPITELEQPAASRTVDETQPTPAVDELAAPGTADETQWLPGGEPVADEEPKAEHRPEERSDQAAGPSDLFATTSAPTYEAQPVPTPAVVVEPAPVTTAPGPRRPRVGTVVWGLIIAACGLGVIAWASGARIDFQLALIVLLGVAGTALLVGSILSGARHARR
jgi:hypothetical protein